MKNKILFTLNQINKSLDNRNKNELSLLGGEAGILLFKLNYITYTKKEDEFKSFESDLQLLYENSLILKNHNLCRGKAGIDWFFSYLVNKEMLDSEFVDEFVYTESHLAKTVLIMLKAHNYDYLHGALGIFYHLLYRNYKSDSFYESFFNLLNALIEESPTKSVIPNFNFSTFALEKNEVNVGLAHGIVGLLKICLVCYKQKIQKISAKQIADNIIKFLLENAGDGSSGAYFPSVVCLESDVPQPNSRLGWCYGDLMIGYILLQAAELFENQKLKIWAIQILEQTTLRKDYFETAVIDAGFCHGCAGIAYINNKIWNKTNNKKFRDSSDYWLNRTLDFKIEKNGGSYYKKFNGLEKKYEDDYGVLEGDAGIGLVLLGFLTGDCEWDYFLLTNDI